MGGGLRRYLRLQSISIRALRLRRGLFCLVLLSFAPLLGSQTLQNELVGPLKALEGSTLTLRVSYNASDTIYLRVDGMIYQVKVKGDYLFPTMVPEPVTVARSELVGSGITLQVESEALGKGMLEIQAEGDAPLTPAVLEAVKQRMFVGDFDTFKPVLIEPHSGWAHLDGCNHLFVDEVQERFSSPEEATVYDRPLCPLCFKKIRNSALLRIERELGYRVSASLRRIYPTARYDARTKRVQEIGERVVASWPWPTADLSYRFTLLDSGRIDAWSDSYREIFVTTALLRALESDDELETAIAHEFAHIDRHHGYRLFRLTQQSNAVPALAATALLLATGINQHGKKTAFRLSDILPAMAENIAVAGFTKKFEEEADAVAEVYLHDRLIQSSVLVRVLRKLQYSDNLETDARGYSGHTHLGLEERIDLLARSQVRRLYAPVCFQGLDADGHVVARVRLELERLVEPIEESRSPLKRAKHTVGSVQPEIRLTGGHHQMIGSIETTSYLGKPGEFTHATVGFADSSLRFLNREKAEILPNDMDGVVLERVVDSESTFSGEILTFEMNVPRVVRWEKLTKQIEPIVADADNE